MLPPTDTTSQAPDGEPSGAPEEGSDLGGSSRVDPLLTVELRPDAKVPVAHPGAPSATARPAAPGTAPAPAGPPSLYGLLPEEVGERFLACGQPRFRGRQVLDWVYRKRVRDPGAMTNLARALRDELEGVVSLRLPEVAEQRVSGGGDAIKLATRLADGSRVESVAMRSRRGVTLCLSTQVGCAMSCAFCATGLLGLARNLKAEEIVAQVVQLLEVSGWEDPGYNLVFMGMGEPLANYEPTLRAIRILHHPEGLGVGARRITVSTVGLAPRMRRLAEEGLALGLAVSLHATTDADRTELVPINARYPLDQVIDAARYYAECTGRRVTLEYVLLAGRNDRREDARRLSEIARRLPCKINLIPFNPVPDLPWRRPSEEEVERFVEWLLPQSPAVTVRWSQGGDVAAACGQLGARPDASPAR